MLSLVKYRGHGNPEEVAAFKGGIMKNYEKQGSAYYSTTRLWDDGIVKPSDFRRVLGLSLGVALNAPIADTHHGVFRM